MLKVVSPTTFFDLGNITIAQEDPATEVVILDSIAILFQSWAIYLLRVTKVKRRILSGIV